MTPPTPRRALLFAHQTKPFEAPGHEACAQRATYLAEYLPRVGWECTVVCASVDDTARSLRGDGFRIDALPAARPSVGRRAWQSFVERDGGGALRKAMTWWYTRRGDNAVTWAPGAARHGLALHRARAFDVVIGCHSPDGGIDAAQAFHRESGVPYVIDLQDPVGILAHPHRGRLAYFRARSKGACGITTMMESWLEPFERAYGIPSWVVTHSYDPALFADVTARSFPRPTVVQCGSTYPREPWEAVGRALAKASPRPAFWSCGNGSHRIREGFAAAGALDDAEIHASVPYPEALAAQRGAAALMLLANDKRYLNARTFEHLASGAPVIFFPANGSETEERVRASGGPYRVVRDEAELRRVFEALAKGEATWERGAGQGPGALSNATRLARAERMAAVLEHLVAGAPAPPKRDLA